MDSVAGGACSGGADAQIYIDSLGRGSHTAAAGATSSTQGAVISRHGHQQQQQQQQQHAAEGQAGSWKQKMHGWFGGDAGLPMDGWLTTCCAQIGQIMLTLPNAYSKVGLAAAVPLSVGCAVLSFWTMYCLIALYAERKQRLIKAGRWHGPEGKSQHVTQYHDVIGDNLGTWARIVVQVVVVVSLFGTNVAQIVASASDAYYLEEGNSLDKRQLGIVFGVLMQLSVLLPTLRHFRFINILGLVGTTYTAWYIVASAAMHGMAPNAGQRTPTGMRDFYNGFAVIMSAFGGHANAIEIMDSMFVPEGYTRVYWWAFLYIFSLTLPHSTAVQLAWPDQALHNGNVYGILPLTLAKKISIYLMLVHQIIAFCLYSAPLYYMCEKALRVHTKPIYIRVLARLPVSISVAVFAVAFPFYGTINAVVASITSPLVAFAFPAAAYSWLHRTKDRQQACVRPPPSWMMTLLGGWSGIHAFNVFIVAFFIVNGTGFGIAYSFAQFIHDVKHFKPFPHCYQC
uniref:Amino acid transporter transmembrane domain-containing protein n=1 Tax=Tetradesmus obliquus TaxID=3088 RepID=A0A383V9J1_TETOB|eukprot:jgi/Sobl393_1/5816/SZX61610.1